MKIVAFFPNGTIVEDPVTTAASTFPAGTILFDAYDSQHNWYQTRLLPVGREPYWSTLDLSEVPAAFRTQLLLLGVT